LTLSFAYFRLLRKGATPPPPKKKKRGPDFDNKEGKKTNSK